MYFNDRNDAGRQLAERLTSYKDQEPVVLGLPRGGVVVAYEVAKALAAPLDVVLVRKIGAPWHGELAVGAVAFIDRPRVVVNEPVRTALGVTDEYIQRVEAEKLKEIERQRALFRAGRGPLDLHGKTAILVDDGIATGATVLAAAQAVRQSSPKRVVVAVPVAPPDAVESLKREVDEVVCLEIAADLGAISLFYGAFTQVEDAEVVALLERANADFAEPT
ncbi:MAG: phosphoribosyltransferase [Inquilinus sp.]|nr:phosphoribosyltransferase [Inquilinus sp.]